MVPFSHNITWMGGRGGGGGVPKEFPGERFVVVFLLKGTLAPRYSSRIRKILSPEVPRLLARPTTGPCDTKRKKKGR